MKEVHTELFEILAENVTNFNHFDIDGNSPLHVAAFHDNWEIAEFIADKHSSDLESQATMEDFDSLYWSLKQAKYQIDEKQDVF